MTTSKITSAMRALGAIPGDVDFSAVPPGLLVPAAVAPTTLDLAAANESGGAEATETTSPGGGEPLALGTPTTPVTSVMAVKTMTTAGPVSPVAAEAEIKTDGTVETDNDEQAEDTRPVIRVSPGRLCNAIDEAQRHLADAGGYYEREGAMVTINTDTVTKESVIREMNPLGLMHALAGITAWERFNKRANRWEPTDPPERICNLMIKSGSLKQLAPLSGLARQPYLRPDGSMHLTPGYDRATKMFGIFDAAKFQVPEAPTRADAEAALVILKDLLGEFAFAGPTDLSAALAGILTAAVRAGLPVAPLFHVKAAQFGSGKSYLCEVIAAFATLRKGAPVAFPSGEEECRKLLLAELMKSPAVLEFDNLTSDLRPHRSLCTALTSEHISGRILGVSKTANVSTKTLFLSSGNNVGPIADMTRRCITIHLEPAEETPATRTFKHTDLVGDLRRRRGHFVSLALTVIRAWQAAGEPMTPCPSLASYGVWSKLCRQPLLWLGESDPANSVFKGMQEDPNREVVGRLLTAWDAQFGSKEIMVRDLVERSKDLARGAEDLLEVLVDVAGDREAVNRKKLGWWIKRHAGQQVDGKKIQKGTAKRNADTWRVVSV